MGDVALGANHDLPCLLPWVMQELQITTLHSVPSNLTPPWLTIPNASFTFQLNTFAAEHECTALQCTDHSIAPSLPEMLCSKWAEAQLADNLHASHVLSVFVKPNTTFINFSLSNVLHSSCRNNETHGMRDCADVYFFLVFGLDEILWPLHFFSHFHLQCLGFRRCSSAQANKYFLHVSVNILERYIYLMQLGKPRKMGSVF